MATTALNLPLTKMIQTICIIVCHLLQVMMRLFSIPGIIQKKVNRAMIMPSVPPVSIQIGTELEH